LQADAVRFDIEFFQGDFLIADRGHHGLAVFSRLPGLDRTAKGRISIINPATLSSS
jgi:hypothetical protein